jgi:hypothetical protein
VSWVEKGLHPCHLCLPCWLWVAFVLCIYLYTCCTLSAAVSLLNLRTSLASIVAGSTSENGHAMPHIALHKHRGTESQRCASPRNLQYKESDRKRVTETCDNSPPTCGSHTPHPHWCWPGNSNVSLGRERRLLQAKAKEKWRMGCQPADASWFVGRRSQ